MADGTANVSPPRGCRTICVPVREETWSDSVKDAARFRALLDQSHREFPELFPVGFAAGYGLKDQRTSGKLGVSVRRIRLWDGTAYTVRPSFALPYMAGRADEVEKGLYLRKYAVPFEALAYVLGRDPMYWYRIECALGRNSVVGTTVRKPDLPEHLVADEHHQTLDGEKVYIATVVAEGCCLGACVAPTASEKDLTAAYGVFRDEILDVEPDYKPKTVNADGWSATHAAWLTLFPAVVVLRCFLHAFLKIRDRAKGLKQGFHDLSTRVWDAFHAPDKLAMLRSLRSLQTWARENLTGVVLAVTLDLCRKRRLWLTHHDHPGGHRTSNMLDRTMRPMNRYFTAGQHLHGGIEAANLHVRGWALIHNFAPWSKATARANKNWRSPAERLNQHRYHDNWLQNLLVSASLAGYRRDPQNP